MIAALDTAEQYRDLFDLYWPIAACVLLIIWLALLVLAIRLRHRAGDDSWPEQSKGQPRPTSGRSRSSPRSSSSPSRR
jgi:heme/copper-type cytochrome/quinol oxidase subunit 2